jgi:CheY-like chemotaxis protein
MEHDAALLAAYVGRIPDWFKGLRGELLKTVQIAAIRPNMALAHTRWQLELVVRDVFRRKYGHNPGTKPLENLLQQLKKDCHLPSRIAAHANSVRELGNTGVHEGEAAEPVTQADVHVSMMQLALVMDWYATRESPPEQQAELTRPSGPLPAGGGPRRVLWVDDSPANNLYEVARLKEEGFEVVQVRSTAEAMKELASGGPFGLVISDMGRRENGRQHNEAGKELIRRMKEKGVAVPVVVYSSTGAVERNLQAVLEAGAVGMTASPLSLFEMIYRVMPSLDCNQGSQT